MDDTLYDRTQDYVPGWAEMLADKPDRGDNIPSSWVVMGPPPKSWQDGTFLDGWGHYVTFLDSNGDQWSVWMQGDVSKVYSDFLITREGDMVIFWRDTPDSPWQSWVLTDKTRQVSGPVLRHDPNTPNNEWQVYIVIDRETGEGAWIPLESVSGQILQLEMSGKPIPQWMKDWQNRRTNALFDSFDEKRLAETLLNALEFDELWGGERGMKSDGLPPPQTPGAFNPYW